ncbi:MAG TPA: hypothetical protein VI893_03520 [Thermoplasmata archaeon]|nr:hypothetical protein [Thermoplasmata archaeon]
MERKEAGKGRRRFVKAMVLGGVAVSVAASLPAGLGSPGHETSERAPLRDEEDRRAWRERRKNLTRGFVPEYHDEFP